MEQILGLDLVLRHLILMQEAWWGYDTSKAIHGIHETKIQVVLTVKGLILYAFRLYGFAYSRHCIEMKAYNIRPFVTVVFYCRVTFSFSLTFSRLIHVVTYQCFVPFSWSNNIPLHGYATFYWSIHQLMAIWIVPTLSLRVVLLWTSMYQSCVDLCFHFSWVCAYT